MPCNIHLRKMQKGVLPWLAGEKVCHHLFDKIAAGPVADEIHFTSAVVGTLQVLCARSIIIALDTNAHGGLSSKEASLAATIMDHVEHAGFVGHIRIPIFVNRETR